ncbi:hypothetical protein XENTR_v10020655 [Xenopus tropicalis]|nr:hypothetical protein XENTR_v10020655 [Xenopus tropicalis]
MSSQWQIPVPFPRRVFWIFDTGFFATIQKSRSFCVAIRKSHSFATGFRFLLCMLLECNISFLIPAYEGHIISVII